MTNTDPESFQPYIEPEGFVPPGLTGEPGRTLSVDDISTAYDMGGYNALMALQETINESTEIATVDQALELIAVAMDILVENANTEGRDLTPYLVSSEQFDRIIEDMG